VVGNARQIPMNYGLQGECICVYNMYGCVYKVTQLISGNSNVITNYLCVLWLVTNVFKKIAAIVLYTATQIHKKLFCWSNN